MYRRGGWRPGPEGHRGAAKAGQLRECEAGAACAPPGVLPLWEIISHPRHTSVLPARSNETGLCALTQPAPPCTLAATHPQGVLNVSGSDGRLLLVPATAVARTV